MAFIPVRNPIKKPYISQIHQIYLHLTPNTPHTIKSRRKTLNICSMNILKVCHSLAFSENFTQILKRFKIVIHCGSKLAN